VRIPAVEAGHVWDEIDESIETRDGLASGTVECGTGVGAPLSARASRRFMPVTKPISG
jgi:hypothetical protein